MVFHNYLVKLNRGIGSIGLPRLILLAIASTQLTLLFRADQVPIGIGAGLVWMGVAVLLIDLHQPGPGTPAVISSPLSRWAGLGALLWTLLVLSFSARLYDPLVLLVPLMSSLGAALLEGIPLRSRLMRDLVLITLLQPLQRLLILLIPTGPVVALTTYLTCSFFKIVGMPCLASFDLIRLPARMIRVDPPCAGMDTLALTLATALMFIILFPVRRSYVLLIGMILASLALSFLVNVLRVIVLTLSSESCDEHWWTFYCGFDFWHVGTGSHLFALLAVSAVCGLWLWEINHHETGTSSSQQR